MSPRPVRIRPSDGMGGRMLRHVPTQMVDNAAFVTNMSPQQGRGATGEPGHTGGRKRESMGR